MNRPAPRWIWNKGLASRCDRRIPDEFPNGHDHVPVPTLSGDHVRAGPLDLIDDVERFDDIGGGELVWVRGSWLPSFVERVLPRIRGHFVLVTGDTPSSLPSSAPMAAAALLESSYMLHWYTQNYDGTAGPSRVSPIPVGIDLHTRSVRPAWGQAIATPAEQEAELDAIAHELPPLAARIPAIYIDFVSSAYRTPSPPGASLVQPRRVIAGVLRFHPRVVHQDTRMSRAETWRRRGEYAFVLSPHGVGLDCHRTWEALALGHVVLVPSSSLDPLFEEVRAFPFASWSDLTADNLSGWMEAARGLDHPAPALTSDEWIRRMRLPPGEPGTVR
jgi:hypothetical protein